MLLQLLTLLKLYMNCGIISVVMRVGIILSIIGNILSTALKSKIGKILSIIGRGLVHM